MRKNTGISMLSLLGLAVLLLTSGCGSSSDSVPNEAQAGLTDDGEETTQSSETAPAASPSEASETAEDAPTSAPDVPEDAPVLVDVYPTLTDGALRYVRLVDLPAGVLLQAKGVSMTKADLEKQLQKAPEQMRTNAFFIFEQGATRELLTELAQQRVEGADSMKEGELFQQYFETLTSPTSVSDAEVSIFYDENKGLVEKAPLDQVRDRIRQHLRQQKKQQLIETHITELGKEMTVAVSADWIAEQAPNVLDNPVDKARGNGKPTFVNFGAEGCKRCDRMEPIREKLAEEHEGQVDVVFVHVRKQQMLASRYGVRGIPHLVFFDADGKQVHTHTGFMPEEQIREWLEKSGVKDT